jgi:dGTPase
MKDSFKSVSATQDNPKWKELIKRANPLYLRNNDLRSEFARDYTRILHCNAYRRLKHKTQVFFSPSSDHVCTRSEHVSYVDSISNTIANYLGLNTELTKAIAISHDIGHSPFGHKGEKVLNEISLRDISQSFWHEKNGVHFVDDIELLEDANGDLKNLDLTYAVRDGIISHCGEIDENSLKPRSQAIDLKDYTKPNEYSPYTWEACI